MMPASMFGPQAQTFITGGNFHQSNILSNSKGSWDRLLEAASPAAFHNSNDRHDPPKCHPNTRVAVLQKIMNWIQGLDTETRDALIMWLYGPAGSGKSAIAQSIAERCFEEGLLIASYFFSRFDPARNHGGSLIATIAYQASICFPSIREHITAAIDLDPLIFSRSLEAQILTLLIKPCQQHIDSGYFNTATAARVVVIDGLDECEDKGSQLKILAAISTALEKHRLPFIFLIASRPEHDIRTAFGVGYLKDTSTRNPLDDEYLPSEDIRIFLQDKFNEIKETHPFRAQIQTTWPAMNVLEALVEKSSGQFIYASTVVKFVATSRHRPPQRLDIILGIRPANRDMPFAELDALYMHIFSSSSVTDRQTIMQIIAVRLLSKVSPSVDYIEGLLSLDAGEVSVLICDLGSLISVEEYTNEMGILPGESLRIFHASLNDFLLDKSRSHEFWMDAPLLHAEFAHLIFQRSQVSSICLTPNFASENLYDHIINATPTAELHDDLLEFSFSFVVVELDKRPHLHHQFISEFLTFIKQSKFENKMDIYDYQLQQFYKLVRETMEKMYLDSSMTALVVTTTLRPHIRGWYSLNHLPHLHDDALLNLDKLSFLFAVQVAPDYRSLILDFLGDPSRSGIYTLNGNRYATAAIYLLEHICNHSKQIIRSRRNLRKYQRRRNTPWIWRNNVAKTQPSPTVRKFKYRLFQRERSNPGAQLSSFPEAFHGALICLSLILPQSDRSEEFIALARRRTFGPLSRKYPQKTRFTKAEIARYLLRVDPKDSSNV